MLEFQFKAMSANGEPQSGVISAMSAEEATQVLVRKGLIPISTVAADLSHTDSTPTRAEGPVSTKPLTPAQLQRFTQQLATVLGTGSPLERALSMVERSADAPAVRSMASKLSGQLRGGDSFSAALAAQPQTFSRVYVAMVRAGEASGHLGARLASLAEDLEQIAKLKNSLIGSLIYPAILFVVSALSLAALLGFVIPRFEAMFLDAGVALPAATQMVISLSDTIKAGWPVPLLLFLTGFAAHRIWGRKPAVQRARDALVLELPIIGDLLQRYAAARLCRVLGSLSAAGVPLHQAFVWSSETLPNARLRAKLNEVAHELRAGRGLSAPLKERHILPAMTMEMIEVGEESGALADMLSKAAAGLDADVATRLKRLVTYAEPLIIVVLGISIGAIVMSVFAAVISLNDLTM